MDGEDELWLEGEKDKGAANFRKESESTADDGHMSLPRSVQATPRPDLFDQPSAKRPRVVASSFAVPTLSESGLNDSPGLANTPTPRPTTTEWLQGFHDCQAMPKEGKGKGLQLGNRPLDQPALVRSAPPALLSASLPSPHLQSPAQITPSPAPPAPERVLDVHDAVLAIYARSQATLSAAAGSFTSDLSELDKVLELAQAGQTGAYADMEKAKREAAKRQREGERSERDLRVMQVRCAQLSASTDSMRL